jgi:hypothetical protein
LNFKDKNKSLARSISLFRRYFEWLEEQGKNCYRPLPGFRKEPEPGNWVKQNFIAINFKVRLKQQLFP